MSRSTPLNRRQGEGSCGEHVCTVSPRDVTNSPISWIRHCFPHHGHIWNYGALPQVSGSLFFRISSPESAQTWSDPGQTHTDTGAKGDNDPLDICEIGEQVAYVGQVKQVKPLGLLALLNDGVIDFKILAIDILDPNASELNDFEVSKNAW
jgi:inorganic pyrophosphatase